jgi:ComF family protein
MGPWTEAVLELVLPSLCEGCGWRIDPVHVLCETCADRLTRLEPAHGRFGEKLLIAAPFGYEGEVARRIMRRFKYQGARRLARPLALEMAAAWAASALPVEGVCLVPVPASADRVRLRGFNQAALLATRLGEGVGVPVAELARRVRATRSQTALAPGARSRNMAGAFDGGAASPHRPLVLVDDVVTTGATLEALGTALEARGHEVLGAVTAFRTPPADTARAVDRRGGNERFSGERRPHHVS